jgi:hypothetical protein
VELKKRLLEKIFRPVSFPGECGQVSPQIGSEASIKAFEGRHLAVLVADHELTELVAIVSRTPFGSFRLAHLWGQIDILYRGAESNALGNEPVRRSDRS